MNSLALVACSYPELVDSVEVLYAKVKGSLSRKLRIDSVYNACASINLGRCGQEGYVPLEVRDYLYNKVVIGSDDSEIDRYIKALEYLSSSSFTAVDFVRAYLYFKGVDTGRLRDCDIAPVYRGCKVLDKSLVAGTLNSLFVQGISEGYSVYERSVALSFHILYICPFETDNGVMARMLQEAYMIRNGYLNFDRLGVSRFLWEQRGRYKKVVKSCMSVKCHENTNALDVSHLAYTLLFAIKICCVCLYEGNLSDSEKSLYLWMKKHGGEVSIDKVGKYIGVSEIEAYRLLCSLNHKGLLIRSFSDICINKWRFRLNYL